MRRRGELGVDGDVRSPRMLSVADVRALPAVSVTATLECAGNGRAFFDPPVAGIQWRKGAVGTSRWTGARLRDVLAAAGAPERRHSRVDGGWRSAARHAAPFVRQVPWPKAIDADTIVAYEMDGQPIPLLHGAPLRGDHPGVGRRVLREVAAAADGGLARARRVLGGERLPLSGASRSSRVRRSTHAIRRRSRASP